MADFTLQSNFSAVPATVDLQGFLYPKTLQNVITVSKENGDFTSPIDAINSIPTTGDDTPSATNPYLIKVGPGFFDIADDIVQMQSFVSIIGAGVGSTTIRGEQLGGIVRAVDVIDAEVANMTIIGDGDGFIAEIIGVYVASTTLDSTNLHLHDLKIIARAGESRTKGLVIGDPTSASNNGVTSPLIERVDAVAEDGGTGAMSGIVISFCGNTRIERVNAFGGVNGLDVEDAGDCTNPILWSQFDGGTDDVFTVGDANITLAQSHLVNGTYTENPGLGTVTCVAVTDPSGNRNSDCTAPSP